MKFKNRINLEDLPQMIILMMGNSGITRWDQVSIKQRQEFAFHLLDLEDFTSLSKLAIDGNIIAHPATTLTDVLKMFDEDIVYYYLARSGNFLILRADLKKWVEKKNWSGIHQVIKGLQEFHGRGGTSLDEPREIIRFMLKTLEDFYSRHYTRQYHRRHVYNTFPEYVIDHLVDSDNREFLEMVVEEAFRFHLNPFESLFKSHDFDDLIDSYISKLHFPESFIYSAVSRERKDFASKALLVSNFGKKPPNDDGPWIQLQDSLPDTVWYAKSHSFMIFNGIFVKLPGSSVSWCGW